MESGERLSNPGLAGLLVRAASGAVARGERAHGHAGDVPRPLLDLGCGDGLITDVLFGSGGVDVGMDSWAERVRQASRSGICRWVQVADGARLSCRNFAFATPFSNSVLEHIPDGQKGGGLLIVGRKEG